ncbi:probable N-acetyltransferase CML5 [Protopterus annectens]|uniref:probable N-acetyltransferase CML5 n=1 Tax=Protopterus annectens TaxID=7888 RepID=UPI001CFB18EA|nr:probable N-acetyltransferase CML5 [Protopterus annectens]
MCSLEMNGKTASQVDQRCSGEGISNILIRQYEKKDYTAVRQMFTSCFTELVSPAFTWTMKQPSTVTKLLVCSFVMYIVTRSLLFSMLAVVALVCILYYACQRLYTDFVKYKLQTDLSNIESHYLDRPGASFWVAETAGKVIGAVAVAPCDENRSACELFRLMVLQEFRHCGIASELVQTLLAFAEDYGYKMCQLHTSNIQFPAIKLYEKMDFQLKSHCTFTQANSFTFLLPLFVIKFEKNLGSKPSSCVRAN